MHSVRPLLLLLLASLGLLFLLGTACGGGGEDNPFGLKSEVVTAADQPVALAFAPDGRLFYAERATGNIRLVSAEGELQVEPFAHIDVSPILDWGLTGLAVDPEFDTNHYLYALFTELVEEGPPPIGKPVLMRLTDRDGRGESAEVLIDDFPLTAMNHEGYNANGSLHFGPDGFLYLTIGDYDVKENSQDLSTSVGKILRVNKSDGSAAQGNPFLNDPSSDPRIFAYGFRRAFNFTFNPTTDALYGTDHTPVSCEELNIVRAGENYGWADVGEFPWSDCNAGTQVKAIHLFSKENTQPQDFLSPVVTTGMEFVSADKYPSLGESLVLCQNLTTQMRRVVLAGTGQDQATSEDLVLEDCAFDIATSPDGTLYYSNATEIRRITFVPTPAEED